MTLNCKLLGQSNIRGVLTPGFKPTLANYQTTFAAPSNLSAVNFSDGVVRADWRWQQDELWKIDYEFSEAYTGLTGDKVVCHNVAKSGSALLKAADAGAGFWEPDQLGNIYDTVKIAMHNVNQSIDESPILGGAHKRLIIWGQGENEALTVNGGTITGALYEIALHKLFNQIQNDFGNVGIPLVFGIMHLGINPANPTDPNWDEIRNAQYNVVTNRADTHSLCDLAKLPAPMVLDGAGDWVSGMDHDGIHFFENGYNIMGKNCAENYVALGL